MKFVGIDLHKKTISLCVMGQDRQVLERRRLGCQETGEMVARVGSSGPVRPANTSACAGLHGLFPPARE